jgi:hypothetical protein
MWILQSENKTLQTRVGLEVIVLLSAPQVPIPRFPLQWSEDTANVTIRVQNEDQSVRAAVAAVVKVTRTETIGADTPQK